MIIEFVMDIMKTKCDNEVQSTVLQHSNCKMWFASNKLQKYNMQLYCIPICDNKIVYPQIQACSDVMPCHWVSGSWHWRFEPRS